MLRKIGLYIKQIYFSFPIQLLILHLKRNHLLLLLWLLLFAFTGGWIGKKFGIMALVLYPEYLHNTGILSFFVLGISLGGFIVAFHLYSYILHGARFRFIATVKKPFLVFSYNNMLIPILFVLYYLFESYSYQNSSELLTNKVILFNLLGFLAGILLFVLLSYIYFFATNKNFLSIKKKANMGAFQSSLHKKENWSSIQSRVAPWSVSFYVLPLFIVRIARSANHYLDEWIDEIIDQNHVNASIFEIVAIFSFFLLGAFSNNELFLIPAAASAILFFTIILMIVSSFFSWMKGWTLTLLVAIILMINSLSTDVDWLNIKSQALGIEYSGKPVEYSRENIISLSDSKKRATDLSEMYALFDRKKNTILHDSIMVIINTSGGGHRSSVWTFSTLFKADSMLGGELFRHCYMISGASGGMIGASYWREAMWKRMYKQDPYTFNEHFNSLSSDLLNPIFFTLVSNDFSFRWRKSEYAGRKYSHDRAFSFEKELNTNTHGWLDRSILSYRAAEKSAEIPMIILSPTILNDGRRLIISPLDLSFLSNKDLPINNRRSAQVENIEFRSLFKDHQADSLRYLSALRMNATFPYILPAVTLPSTPEIEVMDAGIRDNYGKQTSFQFLSSTKDWINENIRKVVIIQLRYKERDFEAEPIDQSIISRMSTPIGTIYGNFERVQEFIQDDLLNELELKLEPEIVWIDFELNQADDDPVSLNFHLSGLEKNRILNSLNRKDNLDSFKRLQQLFESGN